MLWLNSKPLFLILPIICLFVLSIDAVDQVLKPCTSNVDPRPGQCISLENRLKNCPPLLTLLRNRNYTALRDTFCDGPETPYEIAWVKVCCPIEEYIEDVEDDYRVHPNFNLLPTPENSHCGQKGVVGRIIGGENVSPGDLPWMARIGIKRDDDDIVEFTCGGSIISSRYILSAAHCFKDKRAKLSLIRLAETDEDEDPDCAEYDDFKICSSVEDYEPEDLIIHPGYDGRAGSQNDIALIRLDREIKNLSSLFTRPICLPFVKAFNLPSTQPPSTGLNKTFVAGWGKLRNSDNQGSAILQMLPVPLKPNFDCSKAYKPNNITITDLQVCAGGDKGRGSCAGDSGSPLTYYTAPKDEFKKPREYQIGIVSFGKSQCALGNSPVVYTRVKKYIPWILNNIKA